MAGRRDIQAGRAYVETYVRNAKLRRGLRMATQHLRNFGDAARMIGLRMLMMSAAMTAPFALAGKIFMGFSDQMLMLKGLVRGTAEEYEHLYGVIKKLGRTRPFMASEIAATAVQLGRANFDAPEIEASLDPIIDLARATGTLLPRATEIAANTLRAFKRPATEMRHVVDILTAAANGSAQTLDELGESMVYIGQVAPEADQSLKDTATAAAVLATLGLKSSMAGTGYRRMTAAFAEPKTAVALNKLGVAIEHVVDGTRKMRPMIDIFTDLGKATADLSSLERLQLFRDLFDLRAMGAGLKLTHAQADIFDRLMVSMNNVDGTSRKMSDTMESGLGGVWRVLRAGAEGLAIAVGEDLGEEMEDLGKIITVVTSGMTEWVEENDKALLSVIKVAAGIGLLGGVLFAVGTAASVAAIGIMVFTTLWGGVAAIFSVAAGLIGALLSPIGLVVAAIVGLAAHFLQKSGVITDALNSLKRGFDTLKEDALAAFGGISDAMAAGEMQLAMDILWAYLKLEWERGINWLTGRWEGFLEKWSELTKDLVSPFRDAVGEMKTIWTSLTDSMKKDKSGGIPGFEDRLEVVEAIAGIGGAPFVWLEGLSVKDYWKYLQEDTRQKRRGQRKGRKPTAREQAAQQRVDDAEADLADLLDRARRKKIAYVPKASDKSGGVPVPPTAKAIGGSAVGTFSAEQSRLFGGRGVQSQQLTELKKIQRSQKIRERVEAQQLDAIERIDLMATA